MRLFAYRDRARRDRFGLIGEAGLIPGPELERAGRLRRGASGRGIAALLRDGGLGSLAGTASAPAPGDGIEPRNLRPAPAIADPGKVVCVGLNYREHAAEGGRAAPDRPLLFSKFANAVIGDGDAIVRPAGTHALDLEVELGVVIGRRARRVAAAQALDHVAGYVVVNDVSARDWQGNKAALRDGEKGDGQWLRAKGSDTFLPVGPDFVTADEIDPAQGLRIRSWRIDPDGVEHGMQDGTTADMIWPVPELIEFISAAITLEPGDIIATGTPSGVGVYRDPPVFLEPGDRVRCEVEGVGWVENRVVPWTEDPRDD